MTQEPDPLAQKAGIDASEMRQPSSEVAVNQAAQGLAATKLPPSAQSDAVGQLKDAQAPVGLRTTAAQATAGNPNAAADLFKTQMGQTMALSMAGFGGGGLAGMVMKFLSAFAPGLLPAITRAGDDMKNSQVLAAQDTTGGQITKDAQKVAGVNPAETKLSTTDPTGAPVVAPTTGPRLPVDGAPTLVAQAAPAMPAPSPAG